MAAGGFRNLDTMLFETSHKWMAHAPYAATLKVRSGLARRMRRHVRLNQALDMIRLRTAPTKQKTSLSLNSGHLPVGSHREVEVRFVGRGGLVIHEPLERRIGVLAVLAYSCKERATEVVQKALWGT